MAWGISNLEQGEPPSVLFKSLPSLVGLLYYAAKIRWRWDLSGGAPTAQVTFRLADEAENTVAINQTTITREGSVTLTAHTRHVHSAAAAGNKCNAGHWPMSLTDFYETISDTGGWRSALLGDPFLPLSLCGVGVHSHG